MELTLYQVDAFASKVFEGNPAAVCPLDAWLPDVVVQAIALENNLSETAFFVPSDNGYHIRWFTPKSEVDLCGHATLASAYVLFHFLGYDKEIIEFDSRSGPLLVSREKDSFVMDFPSQPPVVSDIPAGIVDAFNKNPLECLRSEDLIVVYENEADVNNANPDMAQLELLDLRGVAVTARSAQYDFVARFFAPKYGIPEDPVTGSAYTQLAPYWADKLGKNRLKAKQVSPRGGEVTCEVIDDRVRIAGEAVLYMQGTIFI